MAEGFPDQQGEMLQRSVVDEAGREIMELDEHGSLPDAYLMARYGVSSEEGRQQVTYDGRTSTLAQVLTDDRCPIGSWAEKAHAKNDPNATTEFFSSLSVMSGGEFNASVAAKSEKDYQEAGVAVAARVKKN